MDSKQLSVIIACYNGEDVIEETIRSAMKHVPASQIIVVSDKSTDNTAQVAHRMGAKVFVNNRNVNKAFSISNIVRHVKTKYVLVVDDDTLIGNTFIPTSLLDEGYSAVAFNVMPIPTGSLVNKLQLFEYRKSMYLGKNLRGQAGAIGNVSGAIGLYKTSDLVKQVRLHSGQFGGEDQQRTVLVHLYSDGKGVTYSDGIVTTHAPNSWRIWFRQRAFRWNLSLPELFVLYWKIILGVKHHYLLKIEKGYQLFLYATDPLRILLIWYGLLYPERLLLLYFFYLFLSLATWIKLECKDPLWIVFIYPIYTHAEMVCRFIAHFYWFKIKYNYLFKEKFHRVVTNRKIVGEYALVSVLIFVIWFGSIHQSTIVTKKLFEPKAVNPVTVVEATQISSEPVDENRVMKYLSQYQPQPPELQ